MPLVRSVDILTDGFSIVTTRGGTHTFSSADLTAQQKTQTLAQVEAIINNKISTKLSPLGMFGAVHLTSVVPLKGILVVSNSALSGSWWL